MGRFMSIYRGKLAEYWGIRWVAPVSALCGAFAIWFQTHLASEFHWQMVPLGVAMLFISCFAAGTESLRIFIGEKRK